MSRVKKAVELATGDEVAIKILRLEDGECGSTRKEMLESFYQEVSILSYCKHPNIVKLLHASFNGTMTKEVVKMPECLIRKPSVE